MPRPRKDPLEYPSRNRPRGLPKPPKEKKTTKEYTSSGVVGVNYSMDSHGNHPWRAFITRDGHRLTIGYFDTVEEAVAAREQEIRYPTIISSPRRGINSAYYPDGTRVYQCLARLYYISVDADMRRKTPKKSWVTIDLGLYPTVEEARAKRDAVEEMCFENQDDLIAFIKKRTPSSPIHPHTLPSPTDEHHWLPDSIATCPCGHLFRWIDHSNTSWRINSNTLLSEIWNPDESGIYRAQCPLPPGEWTGQWGGEWIDITSSYPEDNPKPIKIEMEELNV